MSSEFIVGDSLVVLTGYAAATFDGVLTSPPYNLGRNPRHRTQDSSDYSLYSSGAFKDNMTNEEYVAKMLQLFILFEKVVKETGVILWNMGISTKNAALPFHLIHEIDAKTNWTVGDVIYWKKKTAMPFQTSPNKATPLVEPVYVFCRKSHTKDYSANKPLGNKNETTGQQFYKNVPNVFEAANGVSTEFNHATFSEEMVLELLQRYFKPGQHVLDPFAGSGTVLTAAKKININATGIEIDPKQVAAFKNNKAQL